VEIKATARTGRVVTEITTEVGTAIKVVDTGVTKALIVEMEAKVADVAAAAVEVVVVVVALKVVVVVAVAAEAEAVVDAAVNETTRRRRHERRIIQITKQKLINKTIKKKTVRIQDYWTAFVAERRARMRF
jgi:hypothetical protein